MRGQSIALALLLVVANFRDGEFRPTGSRSHRERRGREQCTIALALLLVVANFRDGEFRPTGSRSHRERRGHEQCTIALALLLVVANFRDGEFRPTGSRSHRERRGHEQCTIALALLLVVANFRDGGGAESAESAESEDASLAVTASAARDSALAHLVALALRAEGLRAHVAPPPAACAPPHAADARACRDAVFAALLRGALHAALLLAPAARAPAMQWALRDAGLDELGDAAPPAARRCYAPRAAATRSLLDLADAAAAARHHVAPERLADLGNASVSFVPPWCVSERAACADVLTGTPGDLHVLAAAVRAHRLCAVVRNAGPALAAAAPSPTAPFLVCDWEPRAAARALGPPPCDLADDADECPFESRRLVKLVNARELARSHRALRVLARLRLDAAQYAELMRLTRRWGPAAAAARYVAAHPSRTLAREVRVAVLLPADTRRQAFDGAALAAAAALAEAELVAPGAPLRFKVETYDDRCDAARAYRYLNDALNSREYESLSAVLGPACGAAFADVARTAPGPVHSLPAVAYTAQAPPAALLAAGDAREVATVLGALFVQLRWRRVAALSEPATRAALAAARLQADVVAHLELPDAATPEVRLLAAWAQRVAAANARVLLVCAEDARVVRAALCAGHAAGLTPARGAVWLLPAALPPGTLDAQPADACDARQLAEMLDGHLSVAPEWALPWLDHAEVNANATEGNDAEAADPSEARRRAWVARWRAQCLLLGVQCARPGPHAPLLYDALRLWAGALDRLARARPAALADLHDAALVRTLVAGATETEFEGVTGRFAWTKGDAPARAAPLLLLQWDDGAHRAVGRWADGRLALGALRWRTADGRAPDDGAEPCALRPLAELLRVECRTAGAALAGLLLVAGAAALAGAALLCRRRAERAYRARLEELGLHALLPKALGRDRWELPRERVVINRKLGTGAFGTVYGGHALLDGGWSAVAVKTLKAGASTEEKLDFLAEAEAMKRFEHENVVRLLGVVTRSAPVCTVMEFMLHGDLKGYLLARRHLAGAADEREQVSARRLTAMARDAARGLAYLAAQRYVHRDVAARNCLVGARLQLKLADFGMTRLVFESDYYRFSRKGMLPVRWMAPESLALGVFSPASDVWAFGVLLYEIVTFGALPFQGLGNGEVLARVKAGGTLPLPPGLRPQLAGLVARCWQREPRARPAAAELAAFLAEWPRLLTPCLDVPLDALALDELPEPEGEWRLPRWASWAAPASQATDTTYLSTD
ncbi:uncharacterized protein LOC123878826 isoform X2 [Maniola jurtina]|uniref:uncharacterized protein LOC123878826 isoform X2 n=1 Tax=Maniola jurtina TaxID=191418 RepID=UPI001E68B3B5|nr:uncharacterized protein LOC123878826 isoform X2 [Maniola jurtina]XP_045782293.1 uncharacterized protein LOC123878826 isoform X2 [Maniola jurtina]